MICILAIVIPYQIGYKKGHKIGLEANTKIEYVYPSYRTGSIPIGVPILAIYERFGVIDMVSAKNTDIGLYEFSTTGAPVCYEVLPDPMAWTELQANIIEVMK
jgi:hypothetical protein